MTREHHGSGGPGLGSSGRPTRGGSHRPPRRPEGRGPRAASERTTTLDASTRWNPWDRPDTLFYLDLPYWGTEHFYGLDLFGREQFELLGAALQRLQGRFILSLNDVPELRELFAWTTIETVELSYQAGGATHTKRVRELIIRGAT